jgi:glutathione synthase/RimK-type ligase-like ATP-grasp enzyme
VIRRFVGEHGQAIFKPVHGGAHAGRVRPSHLTDENARSLQLAPVTIQQEIAGTNIRVFVAGDSIIACELHAETLDFRDDKNLRITRHDLPDAVAAEAKRIAALLHLTWTGIDYRLSDDGRYWFLEANFSPMFSEFERQSGAPILGTLVDHLTAGQTGR